MKDKYNELKGILRTKAKLFFKDEVIIIANNYHLLTTNQDKARHHLDTGLGY